MNKYDAVRVSITTNNTGQLAYDDELKINALFEFNPTYHIETQQQITYNEQEKVNDSR